MPTGGAGPRARIVAAMMLAAAGAAGVPAYAADAASAARGFGAGVELQADAKLEDIGLPLYPGAVRRPSKEDEPAGFHFGVQLGSFGWRFHVIQFASSDPIEAVAAFYLHALAAFGPVVDCARPSARAVPAASAASGASKSLACEDDESPRHGHLVYKVGTHDAYRLVSLRRTREGTEFELVRVEGHDD